MKRLMDILGAVCGLVMACPVVLPVLALIWWQDRHSPFYIAPRIGRNGKPFRMVKIRSMVVGADRTGVDSTAADDHRITSVGRFIRRYKLDEIMQLWNVLRGEMSLVGPRPNVARDVALYTVEERRLLTVRPGMTDFASIVFADEGDILRGHSDPDLGYNQLIRPWKSRLGLLYVDRRSTWLDCQLIVCTVLAVCSRAAALRAAGRLLWRRGADPVLVAVAARGDTLRPCPPPGACEVVATR